MGGGEDVEWLQWSLRILKNEFPYVVFFLFLFFFLFFFAIVSRTVVLVFNQSMFHCMLVIFSDFFTFPPLLSVLCSLCVVLQPFAEITEMTDVDEGKPSI